MKSIEERAKLVSGGCEDDEYLAGLYMGYIVGAQEQKDIDDAKWLKIKSSWEKEAQINHDDELNYKQGYHDAIEKACEWIKENFEYYVDVEVSSYYMYGDKFVVDFRKAMED